MKIYKHRDFGRKTQRTHSPNSTNLLLVSQPLTPKPLLDMLLFNSANSNRPNFCRFNFYGFNSVNGEHTYLELDNNNFAGSRSGANLQAPRPAGELGPFGWGSTVYPQAGPAIFQGFIPGPSYLDAAGSYEGNIAFDHA